MSEHLGSEIDIEKPEELLRYLRENERIGVDEEPKIQVLAGGVSNRTVYVQREDGEEWVLKQALAKLRVAVDWFSSPERIHREALGLRWLVALAPEGTTTPLIFEDHTRHILAMQAVSQPHVNWKTLLLKGTVVQEHIEQFGRLLGSIHRRADERREEVAPVFADTTFFESLRVEPYYAFTATQVPKAAAFIGQLIEDTWARHLTLVHGDYSPKNILVYQERLILLDHEVIHFGDPAFDLGFSLTHLLSKAHHIRDKRQDFVRAVQYYWESYRKELGEVAWGEDLEAYAIRHTLGCMLARVAGRSPLEYLDGAERQRQRNAIVGLIEQNKLPGSIEELTQQFLERVERDEQH